MFGKVRPQSNCDHCDMDVPLLPTNLTGYEHQVAGHGRVPRQDNESKRIAYSAPVHSSEPELLHSTEERCVYKAIQAPPKHREVEFYQTVFGDNDVDSPASLQLQTELRRFLPEYLGIFRHPISGVRYIKLQDLLHEFVRPSIMDIKMGAKIYQPNASLQKRSVETAKYVYREQIGFYVNGMRLWCSDSDGGFYERYDKSYGKKITPSNMHELVLPPLMDSVPASYRLRLLSLLKAELEALLAWFESQHLFHFYTSSILLGVECSPEALACSNNNGGPQAIVRMIDFPYIWSGEGQSDDGYLLGLRTLVRLCRAYEEVLSNGHL